MNKRIIMSSLSIFASAALVAGATFAFFSDEETSSGNTFAAGSLDLTVEGGTTISETAAPGDEGHVETYTLANSGTVDGVADLHITNVVTAGVSTTEPECVAEGGVWTGECTGNTPVNNIDTQIGVNIGYDRDDSGGVAEDEYLIWTDTATNPGVVDASELTWGNNSDPNNIAATLAQLEDVDFDLGDLLAGDSRTLQLSFHFDEDAGDVYQTDEASFDIRFTLHQDGAPIPTPAP